MALKDVAIGFGSLPGGLSVWYCPNTECQAEADVMNWKAVAKVVNQRNVDARQCPSCGYLAWSCGDTALMATQQEKKEMEKAQAMLTEGPKDKPEEGVEVPAESPVESPVSDEQIAGAAAAEDADDANPIEEAVAEAEGAGAEDGSGDVVDESEK